MDFSKQHQDARAVDIAQRQASWILDASAIQDDEDARSMTAPNAVEDTNLPDVQQLRQPGHDVLTAQEARRAGQGIQEDQVRALTAPEKCALETFNRRQSIRLHQQGAAQAGIMVCRRVSDVSALVGRVDPTMIGLADLANRLIRVLRPPQP